MLVFGEFDCTTYATQSSNKKIKQNNQFVLPKAVCEDIFSTIENRVPNVEQW